MHKIDSFIKESQRLSPITNRNWNLLSFTDLKIDLFLVGISRLAMKDFTFSDGTVIPRGTSLSVSLHNIHFNDKVYEDPLKFDGFRFSKMRQLEGSGKKAGFVSSSSDHIAFGYGRHLCPGRYFAAYELKLMLAHIVTTYDVKLEVEGVRPRDMWVTISCVPNPTANVLFRKRTKVWVFQPCKLRCRP